MVSLRTTPHCGLVLLENQAQAPVPKCYVPLLAGAVPGCLHRDGSCRDAPELVQTLSSAGTGVQTGSPMPDEKSRCSPSSGHAGREPYQFDMFQQVLHQSHFLFIALSITVSSISSGMLLWLMNKSRSSWLFGSQAAHLVPNRGNCSVRKSFLMGRDQSCCFPQAPDPGWV